MNQMCDKSVASRVASVLTLSFFQFTAADRKELPLVFLYLFLVKLSKKQEFFVPNNKSES